MFVKKERSKQRVVDYFLLFYFSRCKYARYTLGNGLRLGVLKLLSHPSSGSKWTRSAIYRHVAQNGSVTSLLRYCNDGVRERGFVIWAWGFAYVEYEGGDCRAVVFRVV